MGFLEIGYIYQIWTVNFGTSYRASLADRVLKNFVISLFFKTSLFIVPFLTVLRNGGNQQLQKLILFSLLIFNGRLTSARIAVPR